MQGSATSCCTALNVQKLSLWDGRLKCVAIMGQRNHLKQYKYGKRLSTEKMEGTSCIPHFSQARYGEFVNKHTDCQLAVTQSSSDVKWPRVEQSQCD